MEEICLVITAPCSTKLSKILLCSEQQDSIFTLPVCWVFGDRDIAARIYFDAVFDGPHDCHPNSGSLRFLGTAGPRHVYFLETSHPRSFVPPEGKRYFWTTGSKSDTDLVTRSAMVSQIFSGLHDKLIAAGVKPTTVELLAGMR